MGLEEKEEKKLSTSSAGETRGKEGGGREGRGRRAEGQGAAGRPSKIDCIAS